MLHIAGDVTHFIKQRSASAYHYHKSLHTVSLALFSLSITMDFSEYIYQRIYASHSAGASVSVTHIFGFWYLPYLTVWLFSLFPVHCAIWCGGRLISPSPLHSPSLASDMRSMKIFVWHLYCWHHHSKIMGNSLRVEFDLFRLRVFCFVRSLARLFIRFMEYIFNDFWKRPLINMHDCCFPVTDNIFRLRCDVCYA